MKLIEWSAARCVCGSFKTNRLLSSDTANFYREVIHTTLYINISYCIHPNYFSYPNVLKQLINKCFLAYRIVH
jgi:hypothetical protein